MAPQQASPKPTKSPDTLIGIAGMAIDRWGLIVGVMFFCYMQWEADQRRSDRVEKMIESNGAVIRTSSLVMERLTRQVEIHETTAREFIKEITDDVDEIKQNTSARNQ